MRNRFVAPAVSVLAALLLPLLLCPPPGAFADPTGKDKVALDVMNDAVKQTVRQTGTEAAGVGSWISRQKYRGPLTGGTSDHDMRVVLTGETDEAKMVQKWKDFQGSLKSNIRAAGTARGLSQAEIDKLVGSTNVYPPSQVMAGVENADEAVAKFKSLKAAPSLGNEPIEGLWGKGAKGYAQHYESKAGRHFFIDQKSGRVVAGATDLLHLEEGLGVFNTAGEVNKGNQWAQKALEKLDTEGAAKASKHVERLRQSLNKARSLERVGMRADYLDDIARGAVKDPAVIREAVARAQRELSLLEKLSREANPGNRELLRGILNENLGKWAQLRGTFWKYAGRVPTDKLLRGLQLFGYYARTHYVAGMAAEDLRSGALAALPELGYIAGLAPGLAMDMAVCTLEAARAGAYNTVAGFQECTSLVEGISMVKGRESEHKGMTIEQMALRFPDTAEGRNRMMSFIWYQSVNASYREQGGQLVSDPNVAKAVYNKCAGDIVSRWREQRLAWIGEFNKHYREYMRLVAGNRPVLTFSPSDEVPLRDQGGGKKAAVVTISASTAQNRDRMNETLAKMRASLKALEGKGGDVLFVSETYRMAVDGKWLGAEYSPSSKTYTYRALGTHSAALRHELSLTATVVSADVEEHSLLGGYRRTFESTVSDTFSIVEDVPRGSIRVSGPSKAKVNRRFSLTAEIVGATVPSSRLAVGWARSGRRVGGAPTFSTAEASAGTYTYLAELFAKQGDKYVKLADARHTVVVEKEETKTPAGTPGKKPADTPAQGGQKPPVKNDPPPPPKDWGALTEKERQGVLDCLCRCNSSASSSVAVGYNPKPSDASPSCAKLSNGPCINQGFGCWRHFPDGGSECAKGCYKRYNTTGAPASVLNAGKDGK
ncbi:MAG: hypothetical protein A4E67_01659 [Syntrophaceae bacterium PtaB.Bin038]|nr:MAG: hypothetical protein A4E67_01659 [Syntrophaceae bacterium PtaB.Bin038]